MTEENLEGKAEETTPAVEAKATAEGTEESAEIQTEEAVSAEELQKQEEHRERSKLGRKVAAMELRQTEMLDKMDEFLSTATKAAQTPLDPDAPLDVKTYERLKQQEQEQLTQESTTYGRSYMKRIQQIAVDADDEAMHLKVVDLITDDSPGAEFNVKSHKDPATAAELNYYKAMAHVQSGRTDKPKPNLKKDKNLPPAGNASETKVKEVDEINLSPEELDYVKRRGLSNEQVKKLMKNKDPIYSSGQMI